VSYQQILINFTDNSGPVMIFNELKFI